MSPGLVICHSEMAAPIVKQFCAKCWRWLMASDRPNCAFAKRSPIFLLDERSARMGKRFSGILVARVSHDGLSMRILGCDLFSVCDPLIDSKSTFG